LQSDAAEGGDATPPALSFGDQIRAQREEQARLRLEADPRSVKTVCAAKKQIPISSSTSHSKSIVYGIADCLTINELC